MKYTNHLNRGIFGGGIGSGIRHGAVANALLQATERNEHSSARMASLASRAMQQPETLTLAEIKSLGACVLTQAPDRR